MPQVTDNEEISEMGGKPLKGKLKQSGRDWKTQSTYKAQVPGIETGVNGGGRQRQKPLSQPD